MIDSFEFSAFQISPTSPSHKKGTFPTSYKTSEFFEKSPLSEAGKHPDFQVTLCLQNVSTNVDFAYIESE